MKAASQLPVRRRDPALMILDEQDNVHWGDLKKLDQTLKAGDLVVVNDAATIPGIFSGFHEPTRRQLEVRLVNYIGDSYEDPRHWHAVLFAAGNWRTPTENRPPFLGGRVGDIIRFCDGYAVEIAANENGLTHVTWHGDDVWSAIYRLGQPIQYFYHRENLQLYDVQTPFSRQPAALEAPSASFHFQWEKLLSWRNRGIRVAFLTHAAGVSTLGNETLDKQLPLAELSTVPQQTASLLGDTKKGGGRVIALGTSVMRALESAANGKGGIASGTHRTSLRISHDYSPQVVDGLITGMHDIGASHLALLESLVNRGALLAAYGEAQKRGFAWHEYGDLCLVMRRSDAA